MSLTPCLLILFKKFQGITIKEWIEAVTAGFDAVTLDGATDEFAKVEILANKEKEIFPLKARDLCVNQSFAFLRSKGKVMDDESSGGESVDMESMMEAAGLY